MKEQDGLATHLSKTIITKEEFLELNEQAASKMGSNTDLQTKALEVFSEADKNRWVHQSTWFGEPVLNLPQDMFALQDIVWRTKPDFIIEIGVAWGGGLLFNSMLLEMIGGKKVIGVDIFIPSDLRERLASHGRLSERLELIEGSSTSSDTISQIKTLLEGSKEVLVILDSHHTHEHVMNELEAYSNFVGKGQYLICGDTIINYIPQQDHRPRPWGPGNNPATAVKEFLSKNHRFEIDKKIDNRLLFSCHPGGYLKAIKD